MALDRGAEYPGQVDTDANYPYGKPRNEIVEGDGTGTPWEEKLVQDYEGFFQSLLVEGREIPNGIPDKVGASQFLNGLRKLLQPLAVLTWDQPRQLDDNTLPLDPAQARNLVVSPRGGGVNDKLIMTGDGGSEWGDVTLASPTGVSMECAAADPAGTKAIASGFKSGGTNIQVNAAFDSLTSPGTWAAITPPGTPTDLACALFDPNTSRFIVIGKTGSAPYIATCEAADLTTWTQRTVPASISGAKTGLSITRIGTTIVASWEDQTRVAYSTDGGLNWTASTTVLTSAKYVVTAGETAFLAVQIDATTAKVYISTDGITWTAKPDFVRGGGGVTRYNIKFLGGVFLIGVTSNAYYHYSLDYGATWTRVYYDNGKVISNWCVVQNRLLLFRNLSTAVWMERSLSTALPLNV